METTSLNQKAFCQQHGIVYGSFHYWYKRFREVESPKSEGFIPVQFGNAVADIFASVTFSNKNGVHLHQMVNPEYIRTSQLVMLHLASN